MNREEWKDIIGYEGLYSVSSSGRVRKTFTERILKQSKNPLYFAVSLRKNKQSKSFLVHRLVALAFHGEPKDRKVVNHIDFDKYNNSVDNLEYVTTKENVHHTMNSKRHEYGEKHWCSKMTNRDVVLCKKLHKNNVRRSVLARCFGVSEKTIYNVVKGILWEFAEDEVNTFKPKVEKKSIKELQDKLVKFFSIESLTLNESTIVHLVAMISQHSYYADKPKVEVTEDEMKLNVRQSLLGHGKLHKKYWAEPTKTQEISYGRWRQDLAEGIVEHLIQLLKDKGIL